MTKHSGATPTGTVSTARAQDAVLGRDRGVSERIYDYIRTGRADKSDRPGGRSDPPSARS